MNLSKAFPAVYSYTTPEVKNIIRELVEKYPVEVIDEGWTRSDLTEYQDVPFKELMAVRSDEVLGLETFGFRYPTYGSDHAICEYLTYLRVNEGREFIYVFEDDYEGYIERAKSRGLKPISLPITCDPRKLSPGVWFISNPSARDGNVLPEGVIDGLLQATHRVVYDLAYLGTTPWRQFDLRHEGVDAAFVSLSKPYGLFSHRIGLSFFRKPVPSLLANQLWFKNIFGLTLAARVLKGINASMYARKYKTQQRLIVDKLREDSGLPLKASDAFLLAHITPEDTEQLTVAQRKELDRFRRGKGFRFCLTPFFVEEEVDDSQ